MLSSQANFRSVMLAGFWQVKIWKMFENIYLKVITNFKDKNIASYAQNTSCIANYGKFKDTGYVIHLIFKALKKCILLQMIKHATNTELTFFLSSLFLFYKVLLVCCYSCPGHSTIYAVIIAC